MALIFYFLILLIFFLIFYKKHYSFSIKKVLLIAILIRLLTLIIFSKSSSADLTSFITEGQINLSGKGIFPGVYFPFFAEMGILAIKLSQYLNPLIFLKSIFTLFDIGIVYLIFKISKNSKLALLYALNPPSILSITIHGQFDSAPLFFMLLGIYFNQNKQQINSIMSFSAAIWTKTWPALFLPPIFRQTKNKWIYVLLVTIPFTSLFIHSYLFNISPITILLRIVNYFGLYSYWGVSQITSVLLPNLHSIIIKILPRLFLISFIIYSLIYKYKNTNQGITKLMLFFFAFTPTFGSQWLAWLIPFVIITKNKFTNFFIISLTIYYICVYYINVYTLDQSFFNTWDNISRILGLIVWVIVLKMFILETFSLAKKKNL